MDKITQNKRKAIYNICSLILEYLPTISAATIVFITLQAAITGDITLYPNSKGETIKHASGFIRLTLKYLLIMGASLYMGFCRLHRLQITYCYLYYFLRLFNRYYGLGNAITPLLWITGILGVILLGYIGYKIAKKKYGQYHKTIYHRHTRDN